MASNYPPKKNVAFTMGFFVSRTTALSSPTPPGLQRGPCGPERVGDHHRTLTVVDSTTGLCSNTLAQATMNGDQIDGKIVASDTGAVPVTFKISRQARP
jgi:hypothetical protein